MTVKIALNNILHKIHRESREEKSASVDAEFIGWQNLEAGKSIALYNITAKDHPLYRSTVSSQTLREQQLRIPPTPPKQES